MPPATEMAEKEVAAQCRPLAPRDAKPLRTERSTLVPEMPPTGEDHGDAVLITGGDDLVIPAGAARLDDRGNTRLGGAVDRVIKREKGIGGEHSRAGPVAGFFQGDFD